MVTWVLPVRWRSQAITKPAKVPSTVGAEVDDDHGDRLADASGLLAVADEVNAAPELRLLI
jgi:hypothetical protein